MSDHNESIASSKEWRVATDPKSSMDDGEF
jgi:hypothetical protein